MPAEKLLCGSPPQAEYPALYGTQAVFFMRRVIISGVRTIRSVCSAIPMIYSFIHFQ